MSEYFICGTGTGVGKTIIAAAIAAGSDRATYWKPVQTGPEHDTPVIKHQAPGAQLAKETCLFAAPLSPDQAARQEAAPQATLAILSAAYQEIRSTAATLITESAGGLLVPLNDAGETWLDFLHNHAWSPVLVATSALGTINHTALSIHALHGRGLAPKAIILSGPENPENLASLQRLFPHLAARFYAFPFLEGLGANPAWLPACKALTAFLTALKPDLYNPEEDRRHIWHPFTQHKNMAPPLTITRAKGVWLYDQQGQRYFDATSSWWVNTIGHGRPEIAAAISHQQQTLDHTIFAGICHEPAAKLARSLCHLTGPDLSRVFFSDNGSCAVEIAMKMALQSQSQRGRSGKQFLCLKGGYHGDTFGAMAAGRSSGFYEPFAAHLFANLWLTPVTNHPSALCPEGEGAFAAAATAMAELFARHHKTLAAVLIEPLIQGAGGMLVHYKPWLQELCRLARHYAIPIIFDEVFTGMGRTGTFFAFQQLGIVPDILCLAKGLTGGNLPLAVTLTSEALFQDFFAAAFLHGHSFTANPISCAAALATLALYEKEALIANVAMIEQTCRDWLKRLPLAQNPRCLGAMMAFELPGTAHHDYFKQDQAIHELGKKHQLFLRPLGNTVYLVPPLSTTKDELQWALEQLEKVLKL